MQGQATAAGQELDRRKKKQAQWRVDPQKKKQPQRRAPTCQGCQGEKHVQRWASLLAVPGQGALQVQRHGQGQGTPCGLDRGRHCHGRLRRLAGLRHLGSRWSWNWNWSCWMMNCCWNCSAGCLGEGEGVVDAGAVRATSARGRPQFRAGQRWQRRRTPGGAAAAGGLAQACLGEEPRNRLLSAGAQWTHRATYLMSRTRGPGHIAVSTPCRTDATTGSC